MYAGGGAGHGTQTSAGAPGAAFSQAAAAANDLDALVFEFGTAKCKFGYAGEDFPRVFEAPTEVLQHHREGEEDTEAEGEMEAMRRAIRMESDCEEVAQWLFDAASTRLQTRLSEHPLLLVERPFALPHRDATTGLPDGSGSKDSSVEASKESSAAATAASSSHETANGRSSGGKKRDGKARERMVEVLMEQMDVPALFCAKSAVLACYANARTSGLVVEMGATYTSVTSVHEGYACAYPKSQMMVYGGYDLDAFLRARLHALLSKEQQQQLGQGTARSRAWSAYYWSQAVETKESGLCRVADGAFDEAQNAQLPKIGYELPDKTIVQLGTERFSVGEQYFATAGSEPSVVAVTPSEGSGGANTTTSDADAGTGTGAGVRRGIALPEWICETGAMTTEAELRKELFQNIVVTGGSSCFEGMTARLEREVVVSLNSYHGVGGLAGMGNMRVKLVAAHAQERRIGSFLGGSILASLGSFHEMWLSKAEYAEHGASLVHKKCP